MSQHLEGRRITAPEIKSRKGGEKIVSLTAYHAHTARIIDPYVDFL
ncbi:MAG TPA: 3-methyl-2-oxobutanoate hydroxymethyltransferase, partial [Hyphomicrobiales bacterium]|nr:3-methyl-2-oxobutanoate hydroxymethyltransferase [Hyphomicrobiales bacterium]